jgi:hypothetical protein
MKFHVFDGVFPRGINFTDVDAIVEIGGAFCMIEWKSPGGVIGIGQKKMFQAFTRDSKNVAVIVYGDAETMVLQSFGYFVDGRYYDASVANLERLKEFLRDWSEQATAQ